MQYAWLERDKGFWCLFTDKINKGDRKWSSEDSALKDLQEEGWIITAQYTAKFQKQFRAYGLNRTLH